MKKKTKIVTAGMLFRRPKILETQTMRAVREHERISGDWRCEGEDEVGLWAYSSGYILRHQIPAPKKKQKL